MDAVPFNLEIIAEFLFPEKLVHFKMEIIYDNLRFGANTLFFKTKFVLFILSFHAGFASKIVSRGVQKQKEKN